MFKINEDVVSLKKNFELHDIHGIALDIDETLSFTNGSFFEALINKFGDPEELGISGMLSKYKISHDVPYWQVEEVQEYLKFMRRDDETQLSISPISGAMEAVEEIAKHVKCVCYVTARPESARKATEIWLKKHGFPNIPLIMRPHDVDDKHMTIWKGSVLEYLYPNVSGIIDDNPNFVQNISSNYKGVLFLYNSTEKPDIHIETIVCPTWHDVTKEVKEYVKKN